MNPLDPSTVNKAADAEILRDWHSDHAELVAFGHALLGEGFSAGDLQRYYEKPWNWTAERQAWKAGLPHWFSDPLKPPLFRASGPSIDPSAWQARGWSPIPAAAGAAPGGIDPEDDPWDGLTPADKG